MWTQAAAGRYTRRTLLTLLETGNMIDAYCANCDVMWPISAQEKVEIARAIY